MRNWLWDAAHGLQAKFSTSYGGPRAPRLCLALPDMRDIGYGNPPAAAPIVPGISAPFAGLNMEAKTDPIARRKLSHQIEERLLAEVQAGDVRPGDLLPSERELMARFQVGRPAIREAMQNLQRMGLVEIRHGERPRVAQPSMERAIVQMGETMRHVLAHSASSLEHLKQARATFEMEMTRIAARARTDEHVRQMRAVLDAMKRTKHSSPDFLTLDGRFHLEIAKVSGNPIFVALSEALFSWLANFHAHLVRSPGHESVTIAEHEGILAAIASGDPELSAQLMGDHLNRASALYSVKNLERRTDN